jgi:hypothetical protein
MSERLVIRDAQLSLLAAERKKSFVKKLLRHVRAKYQDLPEDEESVEAAIRDAVDRARIYRIRTCDDIRRFVEYCVRRGWYFDLESEYRWATGILRLDYLDGATKMDRLEDYELFRGRKASSGR